MGLGLQLNHACRSVDTSGCRPAAGTREWGTAAAHRSSETSGNGCCGEAPPCHCHSSSSRGLLFSFSPTRSRGERRGGGLPPTFPRSRLWCCPCHRVLPDSPPTQEEVKGMSVVQLKAFLASKNVSTAGMFEKGDMVEAALSQL